MIFVLKYFWAVLLILILKRICCLLDQFEHLDTLSDMQPSVESITSYLVEDITNRDSSLKKSFQRLYCLINVSMLLAAVLSCNLCLWFLSVKKLPMQHYLANYSFQYL